MTEPSSPPRKKFRWHHIYFLLAAFDVATIGATLLLSHNLMGIFTESVDVNSTLARRLEYYADLRSLASAGNAPGNNVFDSRDVDGEADKLTAAATDFRAALQAEAETLRSLPELATPEFFEQLPRIQESFDNMSARARDIFAELRQGDREQAATHMNSMDQAFYQLIDHIAVLEQLVRTRQFDSLQSQTARAQSLGQYEVLIGVVIFLIVICVTIYGHKISKIMVLSEKRDREQYAALEKSRRELTDALAVADAASAAKSQFLANMSHEIRTPMTSILGYAEALQEETLAEDQRQAFLGTISKSGDHLLAVINDILDVSKIEAGELKVERIPTYPVKLLQAVEELFSERVKRKGLNLVVGAEGEIPELISSDPTRLKQVIVNIVGNAIKFTSKGEVKITARFEEGPQKETGQLCIAVRDSGIGLSPEQCEAIFDPFGQADDSMTRKFGGTGLGLSISRHLARELGGDVTVTSEPGMGSVFAIRVDTGAVGGVPRVAWPRAGVPAVQKKRVQKSYDLDCRVLVAEDSPENQRLIQRLLERANARVTVVENGALAVDAALQALREGEPYDVTLMDIQMPVMDGHTATRELRSQGYNGVIIALTAHAMTTERTRCIETGFDDFATKPLQKAHLFDMIEHYKSQSSELAQP